MRIVIFKMAKNYLCMRLVNEGDLPQFDKQAKAKKSKEWRNEGES